MTPKDLGRVKKVEVRKEKYVQSSTVLATKSKSRHA